MSGGDGRYHPQWTGVVAVAFLAVCAAAIAAGSVVLWWRA